MARSTVLLLLAFLVACKSKPPTDVLPEVTGGGWHRVDIREIPPQAAPDPISPRSIRSIVAGTYEGPGKLSVRVYHVVAPAIGLELVQRWRAPENVADYYEGPYIVVISWPESQPPFLQEFRDDLNTRLRLAR